MSIEATIRKVFIPTHDEADHIRECALVTVGAISEVVPWNDPRHLRPDDGELGDEREL